VRKPKPQRAADRATAVDTTNALSIIRSRVDGDLSLILYRRHRRVHSDEKREFFSFILLSCGSKDGIGVSI
jgi:hypothetical protein